MEIDKTTGRLIRTEEDKARHAAIRKAFAHKPSFDQLIDSGDVDEGVPMGQGFELGCLVHEMKKRREELGMSLEDVASASGLTRAAVSRIEHGWNMKPTLETLYRIGLALGRHIQLRLVDEPVRGRRPAKAEVEVEEAPAAKG